MQKQTSSSRSRHGRAQVAAIAVCLAATLPVTPVAAQTLDRIASTGRVAFGYRTDAAPFSHRDEAGKASGYAVTVCERIAAQLKTALGLGTLAIEWKPVTAESALRSVQDGNVDLLCSPASATLKNRESVSFSIPIFPGGVGALTRVDAPPSLRRVLEERPRPYQPVWRGTVPPILEQRTFSVLGGSPASEWLTGRAAAFEAPVKVAPVESFEEGIARVVERKSDVLVGDRGELLEALFRSEHREDLAMLNRFYTYEPLALALPRGDENFRLLVDRALSRLYASPEFGEIFAGVFGEPQGDTVSFFRVTGVPE